MDLSGKQIVVTGGTGALGTAVVSKLLAAGATCIVPTCMRRKRSAFPIASDPKVKLVAVSDLSDEAQVAKALFRCKALGIDPHRRRLCGRQGGRNRQGTR